MTETGNPRARWQTATIKRIVRQTPNVKSFYLDVGIGPYHAGQHVDVRLTAPDGYQAQRSYSIASAPGAVKLELAVERIDAGEVSLWFHDIAEPGDTFELRGPIGGHFVWEEADGGPLLLVAGGSGIAPLMAMLRYRHNIGSGVPTLLIYSSRTWNTMIYREELLALEAGDPDLTMIAVITRGMRVREQDLDRRLDRASAEQILAGWAHQPRHAYVCGSNAFVEAAIDGLIGAGTPAPIIRAERYGGTA